ncbi:MAG TPA: YncE family protein [Usitatibacter sp.]|nr:YncE family protein [Usitatibacter sp.]
MIRAAAFAAAMTAAVALPAAAAQQVETLAVGKAPLHAGVDSATGKLFVANAGRSGDGMSIAIVEPSGRQVTLATSEAPGNVAVSAAQRRAVIVHPAGSYATLVDTDTLQVRTVTTGLNPSRVVVVERTGFAYVIGKGPAIGTGSGSITEIDLRSGFARTYPVPGFAPEHVVADPAGARIFLVGVAYNTQGAWMAGYAQAFDTQHKVISGAPVQVGRMPRAALLSASADTLYVVGHADRERPEPDGNDPRRNSLRPTLFALDATTFAPKRSIALPETREVDLRGPLFSGRAALLGDTVYLLDSLNEQLVLVDLARSRVESIDLEAPGFALAVDSASRTVLVSLNTAGTVAVFSLAGQRLDTLPIARAPAAPEPPAAAYEIAFDPGSGNAWITNGHAGSVSRLRLQARDADPPRVDFTDLWSSPGQPGWGLFVDQQGAILFATLFTYDTHGRPTWYFMSNGRRQGDGAFTGELYRAHAATPEAPRKAVLAGTLRFEPRGLEAASLTYYIDGMLHRRSLERFRFADSPRECRWQAGAGEAPPERPNFTSLWSNPADPGWGLAVSHQGESTFAVLFTYDAEARPSWAVMSNGRRDLQGAFAGSLYRAQASQKVELAGQMTVAFHGADSGVLRYRMGGLDFRAPILRQAFSKLIARCSS